MTEDETGLASQLISTLSLSTQTIKGCPHRRGLHPLHIRIIIWLKVNKLSLNLTKTNFMIFHPRQKKVNVNVPLTLENTVIKQVTETKFFGVLIDQHLSWKPHNDFASKKNLEKCGN